MRVGGSATAGRGSVSADPLGASEAGAAPQEARSAAGAGHTPSKGFGAPCCRRGVAPATGGQSAEGQLPGLVPVGPPGGGGRSLGGTQAPFLAVASNTGFPC